MLGNTFKISIIIISLFAGMVSCNQKKIKETEKEIQPEGQTEFEFNKEIHNFGELKSGEIVIYSFKLTNTGKNNLFIKKAEGDCGCINTKYPEKAIKPGASNYIEVEFDSSGMFGRQYKSIAIEANTKEKTIYLAVVANVTNDQLEINY